MIRQNSELTRLLAAAIGLVHAREDDAGETVRIGEARYRLSAEHHDGTGWVVVLVQVAASDRICDEQLRSCYGLTNREIEVAHEVRKLDLGVGEDDVEVRGHEAERVDLDAVALRGEGERVEEHPVDEVRWPHKEAPLGAAPGHVVGRSRKESSRWCQLPAFPWCLSARRFCPAANGAKTRPASWENGK